MTSISLFGGFTKQELLDLLSTTKYEIKSYEKGQLIHLQNEICNNVDLILEGQVSVQNIVESGNVLTISAFSTPDMIGANLIFSGSNYYPMTVVASAFTTVLHMPRKLVIRLCKSSEHFMVGFMKSISDRAIVLTDKISAISLKTIRESLTDFLRYEVQIQNSFIINLPISKKDLAERLGIQRTSLSRELNKMRKDGLLEYNAKTITLKNSEFLKEQGECGQGSINKRQ